MKTQLLATAVFLISVLASLLQRYGNEDWYVYALSPVLCVIAAGLLTRKYGVLWFVTSMAIYLANHLAVFAIYALTWGSDDPQLWVGFGFMLIYTFGLGSLVTMVFAVFAIGMSKVNSS